MEILAVRNLTFTYPKCSSPTVRNVSFNIQQWERNGSWAQQWKLISVDKNYFRIVSAGDESMCIAVSEISANDGVNIELQKYNGKDNQLFRLKKCGSEYGIVSKCSNDTGGLDVYEWSKENGGNINQWNYWEGGCQLWSLIPVHPTVTDGNYTVRILTSELFMTDILYTRIYLGTSYVCC